MSDSDVEDFLRQHGINVTRSLKEKLMFEIGVAKVSDISLLTEEELMEAGLNKIQSRALLRDSKKISQPPSVALHVFEGLTSSLKLEYHSPMPKSTTRSRFKIHYVLCVELFTSNLEEHSLAVDPEHDTMEFLIRQICDTNKLPDLLTLELFSHNGFPLNVSEYTMNYTLQHWQIKRNDLFYAYPRRKQQPSWIYPEVLNDELLDPIEGRNTLKILCEVYGRFSINVDLAVLKVETVLKKVSKVIGVSWQSLSLYKSVTAYTPMTNANMNDVENGHELVVRLQEVCSAQTAFCKSSYVPITEQTEKGLAKFYAILKYLAEGKASYALSLVTAVYKLTNCIPLATALNNFLTYRSFSHLSYLAILFEGFYNLSRALLQCFCNVELERTFEFIDYVFGLIIKLSKTTTANDHVSFKTINIKCPITGMNMIEPVIVRNQSSYERTAAVAKLENNEALPECTATVTKEDLFPNDELKQYLMSFAFSKVSEVRVFEATSDAKSGISPLCIPCTWKELKDSLTELNIVHPNELLDSGTLTYTKGGYLAVYLGMSKSTDIGYQIYNPLTGATEVYTEEKLGKFVSKNTDISHNFVDFLNPKIKAAVDGGSLYSNEDSAKPKKVVTREPQEAIIVLLDTSTSMRQPIFTDGSCTASTDARTCDAYKRITAAIDFFTAFANRTQAYELHHVVGAICFNRKVKKEFPLSESMSHFKSAIEDAPGHIATGTALYDALKRATEILCEFTSQHPLCLKRILCLSDGEDYHSKLTPYKISEFLVSNNVTVDTVLITGPGGNGNLRAISHATGGLCFLPASRAEGIRIFEMEVVLSLRQRKTGRKPSIRTQAEFTILSSEAYSYDSTDPFSFESNFFTGLGKTITCSAKRMVQLASFVSSGTASSSGQQPHVKAIMRELRNYDRNPHEDIAVFPDEANVCHWKILMRGPSATPYERDVYLLFAKFPKEYPYKPPEMRFVTPIYHCNINSVGRICHPILGRNYVPSLSIKEIFQQVYGLLMSPEPDDPLDSVLAEEFHTSKDEYMSKARELNRQKACQITWEEYITALGEETAGVTEELKCPLTGKLYVDPVSTQYGHTYEREALLQYMATNNSMDPKAKQPLTENDLRPNREIKALADSFRRVNIL